MPFYFTVTPLQLFLSLYLTESDETYKRELVTGRFSQFFCVDALTTGTFSHSHSLFLEVLIGCTATLLSLI